jgi:hypothetical protein
MKNRKLAEKSYKAIERLKDNKDLPLGTIRVIEEIHNELFFTNNGESRTFLTDALDFFKHLGFNIKPNGLIHYKITLEDLTK